MRENGDVDFDKIPAQIDFILGRGVEGIFACGSTGEGLSLSTQERMQIAETVIRSVRGRVPVLIHVGHNCVLEAGELAAHAESCGADGIAAIAPSFFRPENADALVEFFRQMAACAPRTPFYYYHFPMRIPTGIRLEDILEKAVERIPTFAGVKYTHNDFEEIARCRSRYKGRLEFYFGRDEHFLKALKLGLRDFVGSTYNYASVIFTRMRAAFDGGDMREAERLQGLVDRMIAIIDSLPAFSGQKYLMKLSGFDCGGPRTPLTQISLEDQSRAERQWKALFDLL